MPKTPAQARFNKLKQIYEHADHERKAELDHQRQVKDSKADLLLALETTQQADQSDEQGLQGQADITSGNSPHAAV